VDGPGETVWTVLGRVGWTCLRRRCGSDSRVVGGFVGNEGRSGSDLRALGGVGGIVGYVVGFGGWRLERLLKGCSSYLSYSTSRAWMLKEEVLRLFCDYCDCYVRTSSWMSKTKSGLYDFVW
jgi:hypothetical protein